jgi:hypothetical protein
MSMPQIWQVEHNHATKTYTNQEILEEFWTEWSQGQIAHHGAYHPLITQERCIWDWVIINDATPANTT